MTPEQLAAECYNLAALHCFAAKGCDDEPFHDACMQANFSATAKMLREQAAEIERLRAEVKHVRSAWSRDCQKLLDAGKRIGEAAKLCSNYREQTHGRENAAWSQVLGVLIGEAK